MKQATLLTILALGLLVPLHLWAGPEDALEAQRQEPTVQYVIVSPDGWNVKDLKATYEHAAEATQISFPSVWTNPGAGAFGMSAEFSF